MPRTTKQIFQQGSKTYYNSSLFFPKPIRDDVRKFYSFVRIADDYVDELPPKIEAFQQLRQAYQDGSNLTGESGLALTNIRYIEHTYHLPRELMAAFLTSMQMDLDHVTYETLDQLLQYIYGSAEVIGLVMNRIIGGNTAGDEAAKMLGRSMQYINFIRDITEDLTLGRQYIPLTILRRYGFETLSHETARAHPEHFVELIRAEIQRYFQWQRQAETGYQYIPSRERIAITTAADMYKWTAEQIYSNPFILFTRKVKPSKFRIILTALKNAVRPNIRSSASRSPSSEEA